MRRCRKSNFVGALGALVFCTTLPTASLAQGSYYDPVRDVMVPIIDRSESPYATENEVAHAQANSFRLLVRDGWLTQGPTQLSVDHGSEVIISVESNSTDRLLIEGYDIAMRLVPNQPVVLRFTAEVPGRFEYQLASTGRVIGVLEVGPPKPAVSTRTGGEPGQPRPIN